jgi:hypothetical protein
MPVLEVEHHILHRGDLAKGEPARHGARTAGPVVESTDGNDTPPDVIPRGRQTQDPESQLQRKRRLGARDRAQDHGLRCAIGESPVGETDSADPHQRHEESDDRGEDAGSALQFPDRQKQFFLNPSGRLDGDDGADAPVLPGGDRRARNFEAMVRRPSACAADVLTQAVIVGAALAGRGGHGPSIAGSAACARPGGGKNS